MVKPNSNVLIVYSGNNGISPFIYEQAIALSNCKINIEYFGIVGKGILGYLMNLRKLRNFIKAKNITIIHAHYGFSGLLAIISSKTPVIVTYHGTDITNIYNRILSLFSIRFSTYNIFVSTLLHEYVWTLYKSKTSIIPCGVDLDLFKPIPLKIELYFSKRLNNNRVRILFASAFINPIKNYKLAVEAIKTLESEYDIEVIELVKKSRAEVVSLLNDVDLLLLTSFSEGSPQVIKEAMSCCCPIVATDVGDVRWVFSNTKGCYITSFDPVDVANKIVDAIKFRREYFLTDGRKRIKELELDNSQIAKQIMKIYEATA
jgi:glycosyltransferase involved in cell wall biosynthesis